MAVYDGWYEARELPILRGALLPTDRVVEIGCGIGFLTTVAARVAAAVRCYDTSPAMVTAARATLDKNDATAEAVAAVLQRNPSASEATFYLSPDFWESRA